MVEQGANDRIDSCAAGAQTSGKSVVNIMSAELENILARHRLVMQRSAELTAQINTMEKRQGHVQAALQEGRRIAEEIGKSAEHRIYMVMSNTHNQIGPQQAEIARLEQEIAELRRELSSQLPTPADIPETMPSPPGKWHSEPLQPVDYKGSARVAPTGLDSPPLGPLGKVCVLELRPGREETDNTNMSIDNPGWEPGCPAPSEMSPSDLYRRGAEASADALIKEEIGSRGIAPVAPDHDQQQVSRQTEVFFRPASVAGPGESERVTPAHGEVGWAQQLSRRSDIGIDDMVPDPIAEPGEADLKSLLQKEHTRREKSGAQPAADQAAAIDQDTYTQPMSVLHSERMIDQMYDQMYDRPHPTTPRENIEQRDHSRIMYLDAFLDTRHFHFVDPWNKQVHGHRWQVKVQVEAPEGPAQEIGYSNVLAAVTATLMRYDKVLLNEVFPFDHIDPSHENIAGYFFNCLEDTVAIKGLRLVEVSLWEKQALVLQMHARNEDIDTLLRGEDILKRMRESLFNEDSGNSDTPFRKMLGMMFKNWD